ncbi:MAG: crosslink repair DNA glycosylase YcaQ family protein [Candidatus Eremiobacterota bacterium]
MPLKLSRDSARALLLEGQGLLDRPDRPASDEEVYRVVEQLGFVQVDSINVVGRAHHLTMFARLHGYRETQLEGLLAVRRLFEHWTHDASIIPTRWYPYWHYRFERYRERCLTHRWWRERLGGPPEEPARELLARIQAEGPLRTGDLEGGGCRGGWWEWNESKALLEYLWRTGRLAIRERVNFNKVYDLAERVHPEACRHPLPARAEQVEWACRSALERLGTANPAEIAAYWNALDPADARRWCWERLAEGDLIEVEVEGRKSYATADLPQRLSQLADAPSTIRLLSPFDPILRDRKRASRLFGFDYRFEAFVPAAKRHYGYYVLPILEGNRLVGRLDPKLHRSRKVLEVQGLWWEPGVRPGKLRQRRLWRALEELAGFLGATRVHGPIG